MAHGPPFTLQGGLVLLANDLTRTSLAVADGRVVDEVVGRRIDCSGFLVLPGIVDLHGDAFERHLAPRRGALRSLTDGLRALEAELAANGITTAYLAQCWSWQGGMRGSDFAQGLMAALADYDGLVDMRLQLRLDIACHDDFGRVAELVARYGIDSLVLNDHLPHAALAKGRRPSRLDGQALRAGRSPTDHLALMQRLHGEMPVAREKLAAILPNLESVRLGSHDDSSPECRAGYRAMGVHIAEFPMTRDTASSARRAGDSIILGAPNAVRGGSHDKSVSARDLIGAGLCDALASDYHYPSLHRAAFALQEQGACPSEAWALISASPARIMGLSDRGTLAVGKRADLVIIEEESRRVVGTVTAGRFAYMTEPLTSRILS